MKNKLKILLVCVLSLVMPLALVGCGKTDRYTIRLNEVTHSIFYAPLYVAIENGYFTENGITIELTNGGGADNVTTALMSGSADIGLMGPESSIYVNIAGSSNHPIVFGQLTNCDGSFIVAKEPDENFTFDKLKGKHIIAGRVGGVPAMTLEYAINQAGVKTDELNFDTSIDFSNMAGAFIASDEYDYVSLFEPTASSLVAEGKGYIVASVGAEAGAVPYTCFTALSSYLSDNSDIAELFLQAVVKGYNYIVDNADNLDKVATAIAPQFVGTDSSTIVSALKSYFDIGAWAETPAMTKDSFEHLQDIMENAGQLDTRASFNDVIFNDIANKVA